ncbi:unnamed protein product [Brassica rapa]|uniref:Uncharacterized protein n=1 Tax=Brassica campestris TaxID=3711 RepID=A0A3P6A9Q4_BRACM|nr:unnamed protein product [Brassica rapa]VDC81018.1 unnamed protein product [Brassica rapa]
MAKGNKNSEKVATLACQHFACSTVFDSSSLTRLLSK